MKKEVTVDVDFCSNEQPGPARGQPGPARPVFYTLFSGRARAGLYQALLQSTLFAVASLFRYQS